MAAPTDNQRRTLSNSEMLTDVAHLCENPLSRARPADTPAPTHTVDHNLFIKIQLTQTQSTLRSYMVRSWSRNTLELRGDETFVVHRVEGRGG